MKSPLPVFVSFYAYAGDEKVYIDEPGVLNESRCDDFRKVRIFYSIDSFADASFGSPNFADLDVGEDCKPKGDWIVDGLQNDQGYYFRASMVDAANNNVFLMDPTIEQPTGTCGDTPPEAPQPSAETCGYYATPGNIVGLLEDDFNCLRSHSHLR